MTRRDQESIRNFAIIAHIDHGKSTLADRLIQKCGGLDSREMSEQVLDTMELERERGITIKAQSVALRYRAHNGYEYQLNFIDTPGHVDFSYEVSRSLSACEGALLVVDASQGVEAQTVANCNTAVELGLEVIPVINKIDLPAADIDRVRLEIEDLIGLDCSQALEISAKTGAGVESVLEGIVDFLPPPGGETKNPTKALIIDSWFDNYLGVVSLIRMQEGVLRTGTRVQMMSTGQNYLVEQVGIFTPKRTTVALLSAGDVGYLVAGIKDIKAARVGDTITESRNPASEACLGFMDIKPVVFAGLYPVNNADFETFRVALEKLSLNDASLRYEPEVSPALGFGFGATFEQGGTKCSQVSHGVVVAIQKQLIRIGPTTGLHGIRLGNTRDRERDVLEFVETLDVALHRFATSTGSSGATGPCCSPSIRLAKREICSVGRTTIPATMGTSAPRMTRA